MTQQEILDALVSIGAMCKAKAVPLRTLANITKNRNAADNLKRLRKSRDIAFYIGKYNAYYYYLLPEKET